MAAIALHHGGWQRLAGPARAGLAGLLCSLAGLALPAWADAPAQPELPGAWVDQPGRTTHSYAVAAANPLAARAGQEILQAGGSAVDAAVAVQMVLTLVEPQSSGIGGGAFLVHFDGHRTEAWDGRETAPAGATPELFLGADGKPMDFMAAVVGGRPVGVPGTLRMLYEAQKAHGRLPWKALFAPAIRLARQGFVVSPRLSGLLAREQALKTDPVARAYFYDRQGQAWPAGHVLRNPELAAVLQAIANQGPDALMRGAVARALVHKVQSHSNPGSLDLADLAGYRPVRREPLCFDYAPPPATHHYRICGMPPPSSGTLAIGQILGLLNHVKGADQPPAQGLPTAQWLHLYTEASRLAFADRAQYLADPAFVDAPVGDWNSLLAPDYLAARARAIDPDGPRMPVVAPGLPAGLLRVAHAPMPQQAEHGTSHVSIIDAHGNALALTTTIEDGWGARLMVNRGRGLTGGFLLNNELTDFSFAPFGADGAPVANRVEPGKRPRSSMSPVLVFEMAPNPGSARPPEGVQPSLGRPGGGLMAPNPGSAGQLLMTAGSPGGAMIIHFTAKVLLGVLDWGMGPQQAISMPNFGSVGGPLQLEADRFPAPVLAALRARGHTVTETPLTSGLQAIVRRPDGYSGGSDYSGGADPRREGQVLGD